MPELCIHDSDLRLCGYCRPTGVDAGPAEQHSRAGHEKLLVYCPTITADSLLHFNRQGDSYRLRAYIGRLAGARAWKQPDAATSVEFLRRYHPEPTVNVAGERVNLKNASRWRDIIASHNARLGIGAPGRADQVRGQGT